MELEMHPEIKNWRNNLYDKQLHANLRDRGQLQNLVARKLPNGKTQLLAGYRRFAELKALGKKPEDMDIKVLENVSDEEAILIAFSENNTRKDLTTVEQARVFGSLAKLKLTHAQIAEKTQFSETYVRDRLHLLELPKAIQKLIQEGKVPVSYAVQIRKLEEVGEKWQVQLAKKIATTQWDRINTSEKADEFVEKVIADEQKRRDLVAKYGSCPQCESANIQDAPYSYEKEKLVCNACKHEWHRETRDPWKVFVLKQDAEKLGLKPKITDNGSIELKPKELTQIVSERTKAIAEVEKPNPAFRSAHTLGEMVKALVFPNGVNSAGDNIQKLDVDGQTIVIQLITETKLHFKAIRKTYKTDEKSRVQVTEGWRDGEKVQHRMPIVKKFLESLK